MEYTFQEIERKWKAYWKTSDTYRVEHDAARPKFYILDMFPYPSGAGLHVGHPLGYIASDIFARYKRLKGYNVLHPMGFDAFGLPAEQYALETGKHPAVTTEENISRYREQLDNIGFCYDWSREVRTSDPGYYKWTQWIFLQMFHSWYDRIQQKARPIEELKAVFTARGNAGHPCPADGALTFDASAWNGFSEPEQRRILMQYRLAYLSHAEVWWCEGLGTVLANDEVVNGVSERGGFPVVKKKMNQWFLRITEYADRLLDSLETLEWSDAMKEMQRNWIGKSNGAQVVFELTDASAGKTIEVFTTRPDTLFGVDFMVLAPEHELVPHIVTEPQREDVLRYQAYVQSRSERERMTEVKQITGCFTGAYAVHPFTGKRIPVWIAEYVLAGYGTGAIMAVPAGDSRDHAFAKHFDIPVTNIFGEKYNGEEAYEGKGGVLSESSFLDGLTAAEASAKALVAIEEKGIGKRKVNYRLRDAGFSRQRYWGEPFPVIYADGIPYAIDEPALNLPEKDRALPVVLPNVESYHPGPEGQGPLANISEWVKTEAGIRETNTMPGYAGSSWYFLRYMDPGNETEFASRQATDYWNQVDLYVGGTEHAVGHLLYSRMWTKVLHDLGHLSFDEPFRKLVNQGMIQGVSQFAFVKKADADGDTPSHASGFPEGKLHLYDAAMIPKEEREQYKPFNIPVDVVELNTSDASANILDIEEAIRRYPQRMDAVYHVRDGYYLEGQWYDNQGNESAPLQFLVESGVEKMSKSKYNVVNPDDIVARYGADTFRMYEMFLGPIDVSKPWDTKGIEGVHRFLKKLWRLYFEEQSGWAVGQEEPSAAEWKLLHRTIRKTEEDIERFAFNTVVSQFMICVNELTALKCRKAAILEPLIILLAPFAPHLAEELWSRSGKDGSVLDAPFPPYDEKYLVEDSKQYPVAFNGKTRLEMEFPLEATQAEVEAALLGNPEVQKWLDGKPLKKLIYVKGKMINIVC